MSSSSGMNSSAENSGNAVNRKTITLRTWLKIAAAVLVCMALALYLLRNVLLGMRGKPDAEMRKRAEELIDQVGLTPWGHHLANDLSGGQQQRVAIARALVMQPALVRADEPTGNLDSQPADTIFDLMRSLSQIIGTTFLIVTHDPRLAKRCDRIIELAHGHIDSDKPNTATHTGDNRDETASSPA